MALIDGWGWKVMALDRQTGAARKAEVRYGSDDMRAVAMLMAAQLNGLVPPHSGAIDGPARDASIGAALRDLAMPEVKAAKNSSLPQRNLEIWIGQP